MTDILEKFFWEYFKLSGNIDAFMGYMDARKVNEETEERTGLEVK